MNLSLINAMKMVCNMELKLQGFWDLHPYESNIGQRWKSKVLLPDFFQKKNKVSEITPNTNQLALPTLFPPSLSSKMDVKIVKFNTFVIFVCKKSHFH